MEGGAERLKILCGELLSEFGSEVVGRKAAEGGSRRSNKSFGVITNAADSGE